MLYLDAQPDYIIIKKILINNPLFIDSFLRFLIHFIDTVASDNSDNTSAITSTDSFHSVPDAGKYDIRPYLVNPLVLLHRFW